MTGAAGQSPDVTGTAEDLTETELQGGGTTVVVRVGNTVRRPVRSWSHNVHALLGHLRAVGFAGAPRFLGIDEAGREILDHLDGEVGNYPLSTDVRSEQALVSAGRLLREYHDATTEFATVHATGWQFDALEPVEVICHGDFAPYNCVFTGDTATGVIDFDAARPGPRAWDLAYALYRFAPLTHPANTDGFGDTTEQARRARLFLDSYGCNRDERAAAVGMVAFRLKSLVTFMWQAAADGDENFARHIAQGHADLYLHDTVYMTQNMPAWQQRIVD